MGLHDQIELLYEKGQGTLRVQLDQSDAHDWSVHISGNRSAFEFLAQGIADVLEGTDCKFSVAPFGPGSGWFGRTIEEDSDGYHMAGRVLMPNEGGLYVHCQPCERVTETIPGGHGLAWLCFSNELSTSGLPELDYDPAYLFVEGRAEELLRFKHLFLQAANGDALVWADRETLRTIFSEARHVAIAMTLFLTA